MSMEVGHSFEHMEEERVFTPADLIIPEQVWHQLLESGAISMESKFDANGNIESVTVKNKEGEVVLTQKVSFFKEHNRINPNAFQDR